MVPRFLSTLRLSLIGLLAAALPVAAQAQATAPTFNYSTVTVGASATYTMTFTFAASTTLSSVSVVTQGVTGYDFQRSTTSPGSCAATTYATNATCTVNVVFKPLVSGARYGAAVLYNNASTPVVVGTGYLAGIGGGPQVVLYPGTNNASLFTGFYNPDGLFVDPSGSVFIGDSVNQRLVKETYSSGTYAGSVIAGGLGYYAGPSVDGAGNIYGGVDAYSSPANQVDEFQLSGSSYVGSTIGSGWNGVRTTAIDSFGNVYVTNQGTASVIEEPFGYTSQTTVAGALNQPSGVGVDLAGNVYIADSSNSRVIEMTPAGGGNFTLSNTIGSGLSFPADVKTDGNGNVYIADYIAYNSGRVLLETLSAGTYTQSVIASSASDAYSVAVDGKGNVYYAGVDNNTVGEVDVADPQTFTFPGTVLNAMSPATTATLVNIGNANLNISALTVVSSTTGDYAFAGNTCAAGTPVAQGTTCAINVTFKPTVTGAITGTVTLTDNHLNGTSVTQTINLTGVGNYQLVYTTTPPATLQTAQNAGTIAVAIQNSTSTVTSQTGTVTLAVTGPNSYSQTYTASAVSGVATFNLSSAALSATGTYTYEVSASNCLPASATEMVYPYGLVFTTAPPASLQTAQNAGTLVVAIQNNGGSTATTQTPAITLTVTGPASYSQTYTANAVNGVATFNLSSVALTTAGAYTYTATGPTPYYTAVAANETVYPYVLAFTMAPATPIAASNNTNSVTIAIENNSSGATTQTSPVTLTVTGPNSYSAVYGPTAASGTTGSLSFTTAALTLNGTYTYTATSSGLTTGTATQVITPAIAVALKITPASTTAYVTYADNMTVNAVDTFGNIATSNTDTISLTSSDSAAVLPSNFALVGGASTKAVTFESSGLQTVIATDLTNNAITAATTSPSITVNPIPAFTVTVLTDSGGTTCTANAGPNPSSPCELRAAMAAANALAFTGTTGVQPIVNFAPALFASGSETITLGAAIGMTDNFALVGPGASLLNLSGGGTTRILQQTGASMDSTVSGLTLTQGFASVGGAWDSNAGGVYNFTNDVFTANVTPTTGTLTGAAVALTNSATVTISGCTFSSNTAHTTSATSAEGGAYYQTGGTLTMSNSVFSGNTASASSGGLGGAVYLSTVKWSISGSTFLNNAGSTFGQGGAIYAASSTATSTLVNSTLAGNAVTGASTTGPIAGGALFLTSGTVTITGSTITGNSVSGAALGHDGGGLYSTAVLALYNDTISGNTSSDLAGGMFRSAGSISADNTVISKNTATVSFQDGEGALTQASSYINTGSGTSCSTNCSPQLSALGNYGGPTQTMIPLPGSPLLRAGNTADINGATTDQRGSGYPRTINGHVDIGAFETNYTAAFVQQPTSTPIASAIAPTPTVQLYESGAPFSLSGASIGISASGGTLTGTATQTTSSSGLASFSGLSISPGESSDMLIATVQIGFSPATYFTETSVAFNVTDALGFGAGPATSTLTGGSAGTITVDELNSNGSVNTAGNDSITLTVTGPSGYSQSYTSPVASGVATFNLSSATLATAGTYTYTAAASAYTTQTVTTMETVASSVLGSLVVTGFPASILSGTAGTVTVTAKDTTGALMTSFTGTVTLSSSDAAAVFVPVTYTYQASDAGVHTFAATLNTGGAQSITATSGTVSGAETGIAVSGYVWLVNANGTLAKLNSTGQVTLGVGTSGPTATYGGVAFDASGDVWSVNSGENLLQFATKTGGSATTYSGGGLNAPVSLAVDGAGYVWVANSGGNSVSVFNNAGAAQSPSSGYGSSDALNVPSSVAIDSTGGVWVTNKTGNSVTHIFGAAAPATTPTSSAVANGTLGAKP